MDENLNSDSLQDSRYLPYTAKISNRLNTLVRRSLNVYALIIRSRAGSWLPECKPPFTERVFRMRVRGCKDTLHLDAFVDDTGKTLEFPAMHVLAVELREASLAPGNLGWA